MKVVLIRAIIVTIFATLIFASCKKGVETVPNVITPPPPPVLPRADTLSGREFFFSNLIWVEGYDDEVETKTLFIRIDNRADLFKSSTRKLEVSFRIDSSSVWIYPGTSYHNASSDFIHYTNLFRGHLVILTHNLDPGLIGKKSTIRVKFL